MVLMLNENIKRLRMARGLNQVEFARVMGVSKQCVSNWENDNIQPSIEMLVKISKIFGVSTDYLLGIDDIPRLDVSGLDTETVAHLSVLINDFRKKV